LTWSCPVAVFGQLTGLARSLPCADHRRLLSVSTTNVPLAGPRWSNHDCPTSRGRQPGCGRTVGHAIPRSSISRGPWQSIVALDYSLPRSYFSHHVNVLIGSAKRLKNILSHIYVVVNSLAYGEMRPCRTISATRITVPGQAQSVRGFRPSTDAGAPASIIRA
jgi:hypothetical protein